MTAKHTAQGVMESVEFDTNGGCWLWTAAINGDGYGSTGHGGAHRVAYRLFRGPIPHGLLVCHSCDVRCCVNPAHLWLGTDADNARDKVRKGRHSAKVPAGAIAAILEDRRPRWKVAADYGVSQSAITKIFLSRGVRRRVPGRCRNGHDIPSGRERCIVCKAEYDRLRNQKVTSR